MIIIINQSKEMKASENLVSLHIFMSVYVYAYVSI